ncbi:hypothetical protein BH23BAC1_BH23BAC1_45040 [soil metagenome]
MNLNINITVNNNSRIPKYQQICDLIVKDIENGNLKKGEKIPSINEISEDYYISRDTVEKAYNHLKEKKIIISARGKGFYVSRSYSNTNIKVLFLLNKLSSYKLKIFNAFENDMGVKTHIDLNIYHCDPQILLNILKANISGYTHFVIMPHFKNDEHKHQNSNNEIINALKKIPEEQLIIMDNHLPELGENVASIYQDFKEDIYLALQEGLLLLRKYDKLILAYPLKAIYPYPLGILEGFKKFCSDFNFDYEIIDKIYPDMDLKQEMLIY